MNYLRVLLLSLFTLTAQAKPLETAIFAGGCFWCSESDFEKLAGVSRVESGYIGGHIKNPRYEQVASGVSGHIEAVRVHYNPAVISYPQLLDYFWRHHDFLDAGGQFCDRGEQYSPAIFTRDPEQARMAEASKKALIASRGLKTVATRIIPASTFYLAEDYHQDYYKKNGFRYQYYRLSCGRDARMKELWPK